MKIFVSLLALFTLIALPLIAQETGNDGDEKSEKPKTIKVLFGVAPKGLKVNVYHGKTKLGETPFEHEFVRNSGPVDIVFKRAGYFNVNTRVFTYDDSKLIVKMTKREDASQLYGYREEIPPDAGAPVEEDVPAVQEGTPNPASLPTNSIPATP